MRIIDLHRRIFDSSSFNFILGGQASFYTDAQSLVDNFQAIAGFGVFTVSQVLNFTKENGDLKCFINRPDSSLDITGVTFRARAGLTSFKDIGGKLNRTNANAFRENPNLTEVVMNGNLSIGSFTFYGLNGLNGVITFPVATFVDRYAFALTPNITELYFPEVTSLGEDNVFENSATKLYLPKCATMGDLAMQNIKLNCEITVPVSLATSNNGEEHAAIVYARTRNATIIYV